MFTRRRRLPAMSRANVALVLSVCACVWSFHVPQLVVAATAHITGAQIAQNTITSSNIKNGTIAAQDVAASAITSQKVANGSLTGQDMKGDSIGQAQLAANSVSAAKIQNASITNADLKPATLTDSKFAPGELPGVVTPLKSGQSVHGVFALQSDDHFTWTGVTLPMPSQTEFDSYHVAVVGYDDPVQAGCTGTATAPVSAPGFVCIYPLIKTAGITNLLGWGADCSCGDPNATGDGSKYGFMVQAYGTTGTTTTASGVWVYTAP
jgi:hypothetical protein